MCEAIRKMTHKYCPTCKKDVLLSDYHHDRTKSDGLHWCCKSCNNEARRRRSQADPNHTSEVAHMWYERNAERHKQRVVSDRRKRKSNPA